MFIRANFDRFFPRSLQKSNIQRNKIKKKEATTSTIKNQERTPRRTYFSSAYGMEYK